MGVHEFFGVGAGVDELADAADDAAFEFGGGGDGIGFGGIRVLGRFRSSGCFRGFGRWGGGWAFRDVAGGNGLVIVEGQGGISGDGGDCREGGRSGRDGGNEEVFPVRVLGFLGFFPAEYRGFADAGELGTAGGVVPGFGGEQV